MCIFVNFNLFNFENFERSVEFILKSNFTTKFYWRFQTQNVNII